MVAKEWVWLYRSAFCEESGCGSWRVGVVVKRVGVVAREWVWLQESGCGCSLKE